MKNTFGSLLRESVLVTALIALLFVTTICYLAVQGQEFPPVLVNFTYITLAFFFGTKVQGVAARGGQRDETN